MTSPAPLSSPSSETKVTRANWLGRYLDVERGFDERLKIVLTDALSEVDTAFDSVKENFSGKVRRQQYAAAKKAMRDVLSHVFGVTHENIKESRQHAAVAAVDAELYSDRGILSRIFKEPVQRQQFADSLRQSAARNVENVVARTLFSEKPLSKQVYKSEALANNLVSQAINRGLARGDAAKEIATSVKHMIDPGVPGGISYAARRLGTTEVNNAFHATAIKTAQDVPWVQQMEWHLSKVHKEDRGDECEIYALQRYFDTERVPEKPHPFCRCYVTPKQQDYAEFENGLLSGQYDKYLDEVLGVPPQARSAKESVNQFPEGTSDRAKAEYLKAKAAGRSMGFPPKDASPAEKRAWAKLANKLNSELVAGEQESALINEAEKAIQSTKRIVDPTIPNSIAEASNSAQVGNYLVSRYDGLIVENFDYADFDVRAAQEIAEGFESRLQKHPGTNIRSLKIVDDLKPGENAETRYNIDGKGYSDIVFNHNAVANYDVAVRELRDRIKPTKEERRRGFTTGHFSAKARKDTTKPWYHTTVHEWGHVLDYTGKAELSDQLHPKKGEKVGKPPGLIRRWYKNFRDPDFVLNGLDASVLPELSPGEINEYERWVLDGLPSGYSFRDEARRKPHNEEMIAESYLEFMNTPTEKTSVPYALVQEVARIAKGNKKILVKRR